MNEKLSYAEMLDIPSSTSLITFKAPKKRPFKKLTQKIKRVKNHEEVKKELIDKINSETETDSAIKPQENSKIISETVKEESSETESSSVIRTANKKKFKFSVVGVQFAVIFALLLLIAFTNAFMPNSAINAFMNGAVGNSQDLRTYQDFSPRLAGGTVYEGGVYSLSSSSSVYSPCDGVVETLERKEDGSFTAVIKHSEKFSSIFSGLDYVYYGVGDTVRTEVPIGFNLENAELCFADADGAVITGWTISGEEVKWAV